MRGNIVACSHPAEFFGSSAASDLRNVIPSRENMGPEEEASGEDEDAETDAYKLAVLLLVGATILSLCLY